MVIAQDISYVGKWLRDARCSFLGLGFICMSCTTVASTVSNEIEPISSNESNVRNITDTQWSEQSLDDHTIELLKENYEPFDGFEGLSGRIMNLFARIESDISNRVELRCGERFYSSHLFFYREFDEKITLALAPRSIPDPENQIREFDDEEGNPKLAVTLLPGARELGGCRVKYQYHKQEDLLEYLGEYR